MERICFQRERILSFLEQFLMVWKITFYHISWPPLSVTIFIMHMRNCVMGAAPMVEKIEGPWRGNILVHINIIIMKKEKKITYL